MGKVAKKEAPKALVTKQINGKENGETRTVRAKRFVSIITYSDVQVKNLSKIKITPASLQAVQIRTWVEIYLIYLAII